MITKASNNEKLQFSSEVNEFIPISWKLIDIVIRSIAKGEYDNFHKPTIPIDDDGVVLDGRILDVDFHEATTTLFIESCQRCTRDLPLNIYKIQEPQRVLDALCALAYDIRNNYVIARPFFTDSDELEPFDLIKANCDLVIELLNYKRDVDEFGEFIYQGLEFFSHLDMTPWYKIVNGKCIEEMDYRTFSHVLNCSGAFETIDDNGNIQEEDYSDCVITPVINYGMAMYAFLLLLMTKRLLFNAHYPDGFELEEETFWAREFANRVNWRGDRYYINDDSWKEAYICEESRIDVPENVSIKEREYLNHFLDRAVFDDIFSSDHLDKIIQSLPGDLSYMHMSKLHALNNKELTKLYTVLTKETCFLYDNIERIAGRFLEKEYAEGVRDDIRHNYEQKERNNKFIENQFLCLENLNYDSIHRVFFNNELYFDVYSWEQQIIYSELVRDYIEHCIVQNEKLRVLISLNTKDDSSSRISFVEKSSEKDIPFPEELSEYEDMRDYLAPDGTIIGKKSVFVRALVKKGHVKADNDWESLFSIPRYQELYSPHSTKRVESAELLELTGKLRWKVFDKLFTYKGIKQSYKQLQQAFSDGDTDCHQRVEAIRVLYQHVMN